ncbi:DUF6288 domain-containing protein [Haloferula sp. A504]|uniref:DUF6288 domain-containing protein n=1 Tax=Haloferula sp. A504 TaxID=3373601 RepID=UPI0031C2D81D|nr:DUF6288 domain-containing protein [Verrucomicrobiaceae bacterium E54]
MTPFRPLFVFMPALAALALALSPGLLPAKDHYIGPAGFMATTSKTEVKVSKIEKGSPADGLLKPGDVIVAAGGEKFSENARQEIAARIDEAESQANEGKLKLTLKDGREVELKIEVLGTYAGTAPHDCAKTDAIVTKVADKLLETGKYKDGQLLVGWLGLMATGEDKYLDVVKKELPQQDWAKPSRADFEALLRGEKDMGYVGWYWGYALITLSEYFLMTGDESVLPAIETYALSLARGQDAAGTWGHRMAVPTRGMRLPGYAHINQPSLSCLIGMTLAEKCGVGGRELREAIDQSIAFFGTYVGEGAIPYGVHDPNSRIFNNNGSSAMAGIAMAIRQKNDGAEFFSRQAAAAHDILETGHATYYFNVLWTPLGAAVAGPEVTQAFYDRSRWLHTLYRSWDHRFTHDGGESKAGNSPGSLLLAYCLPRRKLHITGKEADQSLWAKADEVPGIVDLNQIDYAALDVDGLLALFGHSAPQVTRRAIWTLREKEGEFIPRLETMMESGTEIEKRSAIGYFGYGCPEEVARPQRERIATLLNDPEQPLRVRAAAAAALCWMGDAAYPHYPDMMRFILEEKDDPFGLIDKGVGGSLNILCKDPFKVGLAADKKLFYDTARKLAQNKRAEGRDAAMKMLRGMPAEDFHLVAEEIREVVLNQNPTFHSYHNPQTAVQEGVLILADLGVEEGLDWASDTLDTPWGKWGFKARAFLQMVAAYGGHAKPVVDKIKADPERVRMLSGGRWAKMWEAMLKASEQPAQKPLISFEEAKKAGQPK